MLWFALKSIGSDRGKVLTALIGVVFSVVLIELQGGLYLGLMHKARILTENTDADIWVSHPDVQLVDLPQSIPEDRINRVRTVPGVAEAEPYIVGNAYASFGDGHYENVWVLGADPRTSLGRGWSYTQGGPASLRRPDSVSVDECDADKLRNADLGTLFEVNGRKARVVATTRGILPFTTTPYLFTSLENARAYTGTTPGHCSYFLVRLQPGADRQAVVAEIQRRIPELSAFTAAQLGDLSQRYWMSRTGIGISFGAATLLGLLVGLTMIAQSLYALALDHLADYATLKAIGADDKQVGAVVVWQALAIAAAGSVVGVTFVLVTQRTMSSPIAPIELTPQLLVAGVVAVVGVCLAATVLPALRIRRIDPALVLQG
ncbi:MAG: FtsX-like permease family protein [Planctomycetaceae bacterium]|nr:FtsX-like permease family protein [Planctomycetaceae bacterium]